MSVFTSMTYELASFSLLNQLENSLEGIFSSSVLWAELIRYAFDPQNTSFANKDLDRFERTIGQYLASIPPAFEGFPLRFGRLACSVEGGGKRRIFAIGNYVKQRLLKPYHDWAMELLRRLPMDGTFNQLR